MEWLKRSKNQLLILVFLVPGIVLGADSAPVGQVIFLSGGAVAIHEGEKRPLEQGAGIQVGDTLVTGSDGYVHVRFVDSGLISVRPDSEVVIDTYQFDADQPQAGKVKIVLRQGVIRSATGQAGQRNKSGFRVNTPIAAIGIRGTDFVLYADPSLARLAVNAGGVVMAPFGGSCDPGAFSPCSGDSSAELFASAAKALLEVRGGDDFARVTSDGPSPDELIAPHPEEAGLFDAFISGARRTIQSKIGLSSPGAESYEDGLEDVRRYLKEETLVQQAFLLGSAESSAVLPRDRGLDSDPEIVWGRWGYYAGNDAGYQSISQLLYDDRQYALLNTVFAMLEDRQTSRLVPESGRATFKLNSYESYIKRGSALEEAGISNPALIIDFDQNRFATRLDVHADSLPGVIQVLGAGDLTEDGFFHSDANSLSQIDGVLSAKALEAGMLFDYQVSPGVNAVGATQWVNNKSLQ
ncbi:MAG: hypothetical protein CMK32_01795 [Porticoccaceae bacterium]|nr:hypothetical protein [Porticoccaceae bacterium]